MPLITLAYASIAAGLLLGFGGVFLFGGFAVLASALAGVVFDRRFGYAACGIAIGLVVSALCSSLDASCVRRARETRSALVRLRTRLAPGMRGYGSIASAVCAPSVSIESRSTAAAGSMVRVHGLAKGTSQGLAFSDATIAIVEPPGLMERWRAGIGRVIDDLYGRRAPLARALVIADDRDVDRDIRDRFADSGIVHMLSVSGLHVAILGEGVALLFGVVRLSRRRIHIATIVTVAAYVVVIGAPSPAIRSAAMLAATRLALLRQRPTSDWAALSLGAMLPLVDPREVTALGYQLSVAGMAALLASGRLLKRLGLHGGGRLGGIEREIATTVIATAVTAPVVAATFGRLSLVAPATNLVVAPLFGLLQPALFLSLLLSPVRALASLVADGAALLMDAVTMVATVGARIPGAVVSIIPSTGTTYALTLAAVAGVLACSSRYWARPAVFALAALGMAMWWPYLPLTGGMLELYALDVGQGDAVALRTPHGQWIVVDAGPAWGRSDAGRSVVVPHIRRRGGDISLFTLTHPHADHDGGAPAVLDAVTTTEMWDAARVFGGEAYAATLDAAREHGVVWTRVRPGLTRDIDGVQVRVLAPDSAWTASQEDPNTSSVVLLVTYGQKRILLTGDAERAEEGWLLARYADDLHADILKVAHHGSTTSSTEEFLRAVKPRLALVSVGTHNRYGHPSREVLRRFDEHQIEVLRTDYDGTVTIRTDGVRVWISAHGETWLAPG